jgi:hypothetical protein
VGKREREREKERERERERKRVGNQVKGSVSIRGCLLTSQFIFLCGNLSCRVVLSENQVGLKRCKYALVFAWEVIKSRAESLFPRQSGN